MIDHYNAFISYRHSDRDILVARRIQSDLEHFHIPARIRKTTGRKRIDRIFLDKDELGAASNLSSDISEALENAEHLIVICSTATKESAWVPREIEYFLRNHTRRQITTVLVDGEPEDVIPDILKYEERSTTAPDGSIHTHRVPLEPLSCDYRLPRRKAKREELPRLASKLLGCSYDELMNRRRAFMIRRLTIAFSLVLAAVLAFDAYLIYSRIQIRKNLESSLRNQSIYLANESLYSLDNEQRLLALQLALEALPKDSDDARPVTPQAIRALTDSTLSYTTRDGFGIQDIWSYRMPESIYNNNCRLSPSGKMLAAWDKVGNIRVWDTKTHAILLSLNESNTLNSVSFMADDDLLVITSKKITAYRLPDGVSLWDKTVSELGKVFSSSDVCAFSDNSLLFVTSDLKLMRLDPDDGSEIALYELQNTGNDTYMNLSPPQISPDDQKIAIKIFNDVSSSHMLIYDIGSGTTYEIDPGKYISGFIWGDDDHLIMACPSTTIGSSTSMDNIDYVKTDHVSILCYDPKKKAEIWQNDFTSTNVAVRSDFIPLPKNNAVAYYHANKAEIYSIEDGALIASHNTNNPIIMGQDPDGDGWPFYITENGGLAFPATTDSISIYHYFTDNVNQAFYNSETGFFAHTSNSSEILHYGLYVCDEGLNKLKSGTDLSALEKSYMNDRVLAVITNEPREAFPDVIADAANETLLILTLANPDTGEQIYRIPLLDNGASLLIYSISFLGSEGTHFYLGHTTDTTGYRIFDIDLETGEYTTFDLAGDEYIYHDFCSLCNGKFYYCSKNHSDTMKLCVFDPVSKEITEYDICDDPNKYLFNQTPLVIPIRNSVLLNSVSKSVLVDLNSGSSKFLDIPEDMAVSLYAYDAGRDILAVSNKIDIRLISLGGGEDMVISCPSTPLGMSFYKDEKKDDKTFLLVPSIDGYLYCYNAETGVLLSRSDLSLPGVHDINVEFKYDTEKGLLYLQLGDILDIFETDTWYEETSIQRCLGYHAPSDRFYVYSHPSKNIYNLGYFAHYSVDDLINKAKDMLKDNEMPDEVKAEYGIEITEE